MAVGQTSNFLFSFLPAQPPAYREERVRLFLLFCSTFSCFFGIWSSLFFPVRAHLHGPVLRFLPHTVLPCQSLFLPLCLLPSAFIESSHPELHPYLSPHLLCASWRSKAGALPNGNYSCVASRHWHKRGTRNGSSNEELSLYHLRELILVLVTFWTNWF